MPVRASALLVLLEAVGVVVMSVIIVVSGIGNGAAVGQLLSQAAFFVVLALGMGACGAALLGGRRWGRTPTIVVQLVLAAIGYWMAVPSGRPVLGIGLILLALITGGLLVTPAANDWINRFPQLFGPESGH